MLFLTLDVGTTCAKAQVFDDRGNIRFYETETCPLAKKDGVSYVDIPAVTDAVKRLIRKAALTGSVSCVAFSSFGESFVLLDKEDRILTDCMLYTDRRGEEGAREIGEKIGKETLYTVTGCVPHSLYSVSKLLWIKRHRRDLYDRADKLFLMGDYLGYLLTGRRIIDYGLAARTGVFDIRRNLFADEILGTLEIPVSLFPVPMPAGSVVGAVKKAAAEELGLPADCLVVLGSHDQVCATLGAGVTEEGQACDGMGTVECITAVFENPPRDISFGEKGYCTVPFPGGRYCTYMFNYTSNAAVDWFRRDILHGYAGGEKNQFRYLEREDTGPTDILCLPYFAGAATPYQDNNAKAAFVNVTLASGDTDLFRAILEGTNYEMKVNLAEAARYGIPIRELVATGGGANSRLWLRIKSDILGLPVKTLRSSEGGLCGLAMLCAAAMGITESPEAAKDLFVRNGTTYMPEDTYAEIYADKYAKYTKLYRLLKETE